MNRVLVLEAPRRGAAPLFGSPVAIACRAELPRGGGAYRSILVVNDGTAETVLRLRDAIDLRAQDPRLRLAVVSPVAVAPIPEVAACAAALDPFGSALPFVQARALLCGADLGVRTRLSGEAISFEYQV